MDSWYKVTLPFTEAGVDGRVKSLQEAFRFLFTVHVASKNAAMFGNGNEDLNHYFCYFSPDAVQIARIVIQTYGGVKCSAPMKDSVQLLVGHADAGDALLSVKE
jgi:hypothetical protein